jgi:hypothetical protein
MRIDLKKRRLGIRPAVLVLIPWMCMITSGPGAGAGTHPSKVKAFFLSLAVPGAGEYYAGSRTAAKVFFGTECGLWAAYGGFHAYGTSWEHDYRLYAAAHAGVEDPSGKGHDYYSNIENYMSLVDYNDAKLRQRDLRALYPEGGKYGWNWDRDESRRRFERMRIRSDRAFRNSTFVIGGIALNHLISGIDAIRVTRRKSLSGGVGVKVGVTGFPEGGGMVFIVKRF